MLLWTIQHVGPHSKSAMKLLVLAQTPPPLHGQSLMVQTLVSGLPGQGIALHHVPFNLSRDHADIGHWRIGKFWTVLAACARALAARFTQGCDTLYYVPAPGKRGALYRDWVVMLLCRPFFRRLVLHFHTGGLADWLDGRATGFERGMTRILLGRADLAVVLAGVLRTDANALTPRRIAVVPNGIADPCPDLNPAMAGNRIRGQILFLGLCAADKGLFEAAAAILAANRGVPSPRLTLIAAGAFSDEPTAERFRALAEAHPGTLRHVGFVTGQAKEALLRSSAALCLPTRYAHEAQPLVLLEAMAHDLPVVATNWRGVAATLGESAALVEPGDSEALVAALLTLHDRPPPTGHGRRRFLQHFTREAHLTALADALRSIA